MSRQISIRLDQEMYNRIVSVAVKRYGRVKGNISKIVLEALDEYLKRWEGEGGVNTG